MVYIAHEAIALRLGDVGIVFSFIVCFEMEQISFTSLRGASNV